MIAPDAALGEADADGEDDTELDGETDAERDEDTEVEGEREAERDEDTDVEGDNEAEAEEDAELDGDEDTEVEGDTDAERDIELDGEEDTERDGELEADEETELDGELETLEEAELKSTTRTLKIARDSLLPFSPATRVTRSPTAYPDPFAARVHVAIASMVPSKNSITEVAAAPARPIDLTTVFLIGRKKLLVAEIGSDFAMCFYYTSYVIHRKWSSGLIPTPSKKGQRKTRISRCLGQ